MNRVILIMQNVEHVEKCKEIKKNHYTTINATDNRCKKKANYRAR